MDHSAQKKTEPPQAIGLIGLESLGGMGRGMAESLRRAGYRVHVCDGNAEAVTAFAAAGGVACASPAEVARQCEIVVSVMVSAALNEAVLFGPDGAAAQMRPGGVFVMCSTVRPQWAAALERRLSSLGVLLIDAPVSGGVTRAALGQLTIISAGSPDAYAKAGPVLEAMAAKVYCMGDQAGAGSTMKMVNQLLAGVHIAAAAEAMAMGMREGIDAAALYEVITHSAGNSWMFENRMAHVLAANYTPRSAVGIFVKDLGLVLDTARASNFPLPLAATAHQMFMQASTAGFGDEDDAAVIKIFPGIDLPRQHGSG